MYGGVFGRSLARGAAGVMVMFALSLCWSPEADARKRRGPKMEAEVEAEAQPEPAAEAADDEPVQKPNKRRKPPKASADEEGEATEEETNVSKSASEPDESNETSPPTALELGVGGMALFRQLVWTADATAAGLGRYSLTPGPQAGIWLEFYPAAFATSGFAANVGLFARYDRGFGASSYTQAGGDVSTSYQGFVAGLKLRLPLGTFTPFGTIAYGNQTFRLAAEGTPADLPAFAYNFVRAGLGTRIKFTPSISLDVAGAFLVVTDPGSAPGQVASPTFFPRAKAYGFEAATSLYIHITGALGARVGINWRQYGLGFYPRAGDPASRMVTGAVDRYVVVWSGLEVALGRAGGELEEPDAEPPKRRGKKARAAEEEEEQEEE